MKAQIIFILIIVTVSCSRKPVDNKTQSTAEIKLDSMKYGKYIDTKMPGLRPEIFAPNIISTEKSEINAAFSPDFKEFYYSIRKPNNQLVIMKLRNDGKQWTKPVVADFSGTYSDADPFISYDGKWLYFISKRPVDKTQTLSKDWDIWRMEKVNGEWTNLENLGAEINTKFDEFYPSLTKDGSLYFSSNRISKNSDIFYSTKNETGFNSPIKLAENINQFWEGDVLISPNEDYMIFASYNRLQGDGLYISFNNNGNWTEPLHMGKKININGGEWCPILSPDEKYFFFTSKRPHDGRSDVYWVDAKVIDEYRQEVVN